MIYVLFIEYLGMVYLCSKYFLGKWEIVTQSTIIELKKLKENTIVPQGKENWSMKCLYMATCVHMGKNMSIEVLSCASLILELIGIKSNRQTNCNFKLLN